MRTVSRESFSNVDREMRAMLDSLLQEDFAKLRRGEKRTIKSVPYISRLCWATINSIAARNTGMSLCLEMWKTAWRRKKETFVTDLAAHAPASESWRDKILILLVIRAIRSEGNGKTLCQLFPLGVPEWEGVENDYTHEFRFVSVCAHLFGVDRVLNFHTLAKAFAHRVEQSIRSE